MHALLPSGSYWASSSEPIVRHDLSQMLIVHIPSGNYKSTRTKFMLQAVTDQLMQATWSLSCELIAYRCRLNVWQKGPTERARQIGKVSQTHCCSHACATNSAKQQAKSTRSRGMTSANHVSTACKSDLVRGALHVLSLILHRNAAGAGENRQISCSQLSVSSRSRIPTCIQRTCWACQLNLKASLGWISTGGADWIAESVLWLHDNSGLRASKPLFSNDLL